ncbi:DUF6130 family protein [Variovorax sp. S2]|uniref:DUF6130 family protein n=1 Tax=Variovorax sp. S12S4 TaxID=3029170 RepID=UPI00215BF9DE|nr:DUF6130 family protein [Variovorax sp. S12S4]MCR8960311.1 DUF6130 family protein [Variovorax sp. S12S4]
MKLSLFAAAALAALTLTSVHAGGETATDLGRPAPTLPIASESLAKLVVYPPLPEALARGVVIIQYRTENVRVIPVFGEGARGVSPRVGHLHVTVDDRPGTWAHTSADPIIVVGLTPGVHKMLIEVADPTHKILTSATVLVTVPERPASAAPQAHAH